MERDKLTGKSLRERSKQLEIARKLLPAGIAVAATLVALRGVGEADFSKITSASELGPTPKVLPIPEETTKEMGRFEETIEEIGQEPQIASAATPKATEIQEKVPERPEMLLSYEGNIQVRGLYLIKEPTTLSQLANLCNCSEEEILEVNPNLKYSLDSMRISLGDPEYDFIREGRLFVPDRPNCQIDVDYEIIDAPVTPETAVGQSVAYSDLGISYLNERLKFYKIPVKVSPIKIEDIVFWDEWEGVPVAAAWPDKIGIYKLRVMGLVQENGEYYADPNLHDEVRKMRLLKELFHEKLHQVFLFSENLSETEKEIQHHILDYVAVDLLIKRTYPEFEKKIQGDPATTGKAESLANDLNAVGESVEELFLKYGLPGGNLEEMKRIYNKHYGSGAFGEKFLS